MHRCTLTFSGFGTELFCSSFISCLTLDSSLNLLWESIAAFGSLQFRGAFQIGPTHNTPLLQKADKDKHLKLIEPIIYHNVLNKPTKLSFSNMIVTEDQLIAVNAGELLANSLGK